MEKTLQALPSEICFAPDDPVLIADAKIMGTAARPYLSLGIYNPQERGLISALFHIRFYDHFEQSVPPGASAVVYPVSDTYLPAGRLTYVERFFLTPELFSARKAVVGLTAVTFEDGQVHHFSTAGQRCYQVAQAQLQAGIPAQIIDDISAYPMGAPALSGLAPALPLPAPGSDKGRLLWLLPAILMIGLLVWGFHAYRSLEEKSLLSQAEQQVSLGHYDQALELFQKIPPNRQDQALRDRMHSIYLLKSSAENFQKAQNALTTNHLPEAIRLFSLVPEEDKARYREAQSTIQRIESEGLTGVQNQLALGLYENALGRVQEFLRIFPGHPQGLSLQQQILSAQKATQEQESAKQEQERKKQQLAAQQAAQAEKARLEAEKARLEAELSEKTRQEQEQQALTETAKALRGTEQIVASAHAALYLAPGEGEPLTVLPPGAAVSVLEASLENGSDVWCKIRYEQAEQLYEGWLPYSQLAR